VTEWVIDWVRDFSARASSAVEAAKETKFGAKVAWGMTTMFELRIHANTHIAQRNRAIPHSTMKNMTYTLQRRGRPIGKIWVTAHSMPMSWRRAARSFRFGPLWRSVTLLVIITSADGVNKVIFSPLFVRLSTGLRDKFSADSHETL